MLTSPFVPDIKPVAAPVAERAVSVITMAFAADPVARWMWPEADDYLSYFPEFTRLFGGPSFAHATAHHTDDFSGAALWVPPFAHTDDEPLLDFLKRTIAPEKLASFFNVLEQMGNYHPTTPHWYLPMIGVDPAHQNRGIGGALLRPTLDICDRDGVPAYLESSNPRNISLYERLGFEAIGRIQAGSCPALVPMIRHPR